MHELDIRCARCGGLPTYKVSHTHEQLRRIIMLCRESMNSVIVRSRSTVCHLFCRNNTSACSAVASWALATMPRPSLRDAVRALAARCACECAEIEGRGVLRLVVSKRHGEGRMWVPL